MGEKNIKSRNDIDPKYKWKIELMYPDRKSWEEDVDAAMQPFFTTKPEQERSGMGFTIMKTFMDELEVFSDRTGTRVLMKKYLGGKEA